MVRQESKNYNLYRGQPPRNAPQIAYDRATYIGWFSRLVELDTFGSKSRGRGGTVQRTVGYTF